MTKTSIKIDYVVIGAGLTGSGVALELARNEKTVMLIEQDKLPMNRASLRNEGKIHLGLIYAADLSGHTGSLQLRGALHFRSILKSWIGEGINNIDTSTPFIYLVDNDSIINENQLKTHYENLEYEYKEITTIDPELDYLGNKLKWLAKSISLNKIEHIFDIGRFKAAFETNEKAINTDHLANEITNALIKNNFINLQCGYKVIDISESNDTYKIVCRNIDNNELVQIETNMIFNATWDQRLLLDKMLGIEPSDGWVHRLKYRVIASLPSTAKQLPSATIVLGAFGDAVIRDSTAYLSWYPSGMQGWSHHITPPNNWEYPCSQFSNDSMSIFIGNEILKNTISWYPTLNEAKIITVDAGSIFAYGNSDVNVIDSKLHDRSHVGVYRYKNYFSLNTGKLTTAPMFAVEAVKTALYKG